MLIVGTLQAVSELYPRIREHTEQRTKRLAGSNQVFVMETNPEVLVWYNTANGQWARGTWNCLNCILRTARPGNFDLCGWKPEENMPITQQNLFAFDIGGCVGHRPEPQIHDGTGLATGQYDEIHTLIQQGYVFRYLCNGRFEHWG